MMRIAVFASHNGSAARALQGAAREGKLDASLCLVLTGKQQRRRPSLGKGGGDSLSPYQCPHAPRP